MASFSHLNIQEASTVTAKAATVTLTRNSSVMHQELISLADPESSLSIARVSSAAPNSTDAGLIVRQVGHSTIVSVAALPAGSTSVTIAAITGPVSTAAPTTSDTGLIVRQVGYSTVVSVAALPAGSTSVTIAAITGPVSTAAPTTSDTGLIVRQVGYSTIVSVANTVTIAGNSTVTLAAGLLSSAAAAANSSIAQVVRIAGGPSSAADVAITVHGNQSSNSSVYLPVRLTNGTGFLAAASDYVEGSTYTESGLSGPTIMFAVDTNATMRHVASTRGLPVNIVAGSASGPTSTAAPATNDTGLVVRQVGYSTIVSVANTVTIAGNSTVLIGAGQLSSAAVAGNSSIALVVRIAGGPSSAADLVSNVSSVAGIVAVRPSDTNWASSAGFHFTSSGELNVNASFTGSTQVEVRALPSGMVSSAAPASNDTGLFVRQIGYVAPSTTVTVAALPANSSIVAVGSFASGLISSAAPAAGSSGLVVWPVGYSTIVTVAAMPANSSQVEVRAMPANSSLVSVTAFPSAMVSTSAPAHGSSALIVRQVVSSLQSTTVTITSSNSTVVLTVLSSQTGNQRVYAYFIGASTSGNHSTLLLGNSTNPTLWGVVMSSGVWGANMAVSPPGWLFETGAGNPLTARLESASTAITARITLSYMVP